MTTNKTSWTTIACRSGNHEGCPGWFREDIQQPWSNATCDCSCHNQKPKPKTPKTEAR